MQVGERDGARTGWPYNVNRGIERNERLSEITGIGRDTCIAGAEDRMFAIDATQCCAARTRIALVAGGPTRVTEIVAASTLQDIAAKSRHIADLRAGRQMQRL